MPKMVFMGRARVCFVRSFPQDDLLSSFSSSSRTFGQGERERKKAQRENELCVLSSRSFFLIFYSGRGRFSPVPSSRFLVSPVPDVALPQS